MLKATIDDISRPIGELYEPGKKIATISDVAPPGWLELGYEFRYCAQIDVTATDMIVWSPVFTYEIDVAGLTFLDPAFLDRRVLYFNGASFEEIDSDIRDIGMGRRLYFPAQKNLLAAASDTTSYWLFWNSSTAFATKTNRDNIFLFHHECDTKTNWNDYGPAAWNVVGSKFQVTPGGASRTLNTTDVGADDIVIYGEVRNNAAGGNVGISCRADAALNNGQVIWIAPAVNRLRKQYWTGFVGVENLLVVYACNFATYYIIKVKMVGNNYEAWTELQGTPIIGPALTAWVSALGAGDRNVGFMQNSAPNSTFDNLYVLKAVTNDPTLTFAATQNVVDIMPKNITGVFHE